MSATGLFIFLIAIIGIAVLGALIAVIDAIVAEVMELQDQENTNLPFLEKQMRDRKSTRLNSSHMPKSRMPSSA